MPSYDAEGCVMADGQGPPVAVGEVGGTHTWVRNDRWMRLDVYSHETLHNYNLMHAWQGAVEYNDTSCIM